MQAELRARLVELQASRARLESKLPAQATAAQPVVRGRETRWRSRWQSCAG